MFAALRLLPYIRPHSAWLAVATAVAVCQALLVIGSPYIVRHLTDAALAADQQAFVQYLYLAAALTLSAMLTTYLRVFCDTAYTSRTIRDFRNALTSHVQHLPVSYVEKRHSGDMVSRINGDVGATSQVLGGVSSLVYQPVMLIGGVVYLLLISWKLLLAATILMPFASLAHLRLSRPLEPLNRELREQLAEATVATQDAVSGSPVVRAFDLQSTLGQKYWEILTRVKDTAMGVGRVDAVLQLVFFILRFTPQLVLPLLGGYLIMTGELTPGGLLASLTLVWIIFLPVEALQDIVRHLRQAAPSLARLFEILDEPQEQQSSGFPFIVQPAAPPVAFADVDFAYDGGAVVLSGLTFDLRQGETVALVGPSGSGKSTVLKLLCGFYRAGSGAVRVFGNQVGEADLAATRASLALMTQDTYLYPGTIRQNIARGRSGATDEEVEAAARAANAHDFITDLPRQYGTGVGEGGVGLSGGQRQRVALARAILKDAPILLLDEPTAALDAESEALIEQALTRFARGRTVLVIAHRLSTIRNASRVLVLSDGRVVETGHHDELMGRDTLYRRLYMDQTRDQENGPEVSAEGPC